MTNTARGRREAKVCDHPQIRIILRADDSENRTDDIGVAWHPGDLLDGHVQITTAVQLTYMRIQVFFEGIMSLHFKRVDSVSLLGEQEPLGLGASWIIPIHLISNQRLWHTRYAAEVRQMLWL